LLFFLNIFSFRYSQQKVLVIQKRICRERNEHKNTPPKKCIEKTKEERKERDAKILCVKNSKNSGFSREKKKKKKIFFRSKKFSTEKFRSFFCLLSRFLFFTTDWTDAISRVITDS